LDGTDVQLAGQTDRRSDGTNWVGNLSQ